MSNKKILVPVDATQESLISINHLKKNYKSNEVEVILLYVGEAAFVNGMYVPLKVTDNKKMGKNILKRASNILEGYDVKEELLFGKPGEEILVCADKYEVDEIIMAKNTKKKFTLIVGSVTAHVARKTKCVLTIVPEQR